MCDGICECGAWGACGSVSSDDRRADSWKCRGYADTVASTGMKRQIVWQSLERQRIALSLWKKDRVTCSQTPMWREPVLREIISHQMKLCWQRRELGRERLERTRHLRQCGNVRLSFWRRMNVRGAKEVRLGKNSLVFVHCGRRLWLWLPSRMWLRLQYRVASHCTWASWIL